MRAGFERDDTVRAFYARKGAAWVAAKLGLTPGAVQMLAYRLGVSAQRTVASCACGDHGFAVLTRGGCAFFDPADVPLVEGQRWSLNAQGYAAGKVDGRTVTMHRRLVVTDAPHIDHADRDKLNNRRANLRPATPMQNGANGVHQAGASGLRGVHVTGSGKFAARLRRDGKMTHLGSFETAEQASAVRNAAAQDLYGEFAQCASL